MDSVKKAISVLKGGGVIIFPTDTAFGIGCRIDNTDTVKRLFKIRRRDERKAASVLVSGFEMAKDYLEDIPFEVQELLRQCWPGGLTVVLKCRENMVPVLVRGGGRTLGVRMPDHALALSLIRGVGVPILGPSANFAGEATPYTFEDLNPELIKEVDFVLKGNTKTRQASTVVDCSQKPWKILRVGAVKLNQISNIKSEAPRANSPRLLVEVASFAASSVGLKPTVFATQNKKDKTILYIDTSDRDVAKIRLTIGQQQYEIKSNKSKKKSQVTLEMIDKVIKKAGISIRDIDTIEVRRGPGSFTGLRVGVTIANAIAFALGIGVNGKKTGVLAIPAYEEE